MNIDTVFFSEIYEGGNEIYSCSQMPSWERKHCPNLVNSVSAEAVVGEMNVQGILAFLTWVLLKQDFLTSELLTFLADNSLL